MQQQTILIVIITVIILVILIYNAQKAVKKWKQVRDMEDGQSLKLYDEMQEYYKQGYFRQIVIKEDKSIQYYIQPQNADKASNKCILILRGLLQSIDTLRYIMVHLNTLGYDVYTIQRPSYDDPILIANDIVDSWIKIQKEKQYEYSMLMCHSFGSLLGSIIVTKYPNQFNSILMICPFLAFNPNIPCLVYEKIFRKKQQKKKIIENKQLNDQGKIPQISSYPYIYSIQQRIIDKLQQIKIPIFVIISDNEHIISNNKCMQLIEKTHAKLFTIKNCTHYFGKSEASLQHLLFVVQLLQSEQSEQSQQI